MDHKVGDNVPSEKTRVRLLEQLAQIVAEIRKFGLTLDADSRTRLLHERRGAAPQVQRVHDLAIKHGVSLKHIPLAGMVADQALKSALDPFIAEFRAGLVLVEDTAGQAEHEAWEAFLAYYGVLSSMAGRDPTLATELAGVVAFMANGPRKPVTPPTP